MKKLFPLVSCVLFLVACKVEVPPIQSGYVTQNWEALNNPSSPNKTTLSWSQLKQFSEWLSAHQDGWKYEITDTPLGTVLVLQHRGGKKTWVNLSGDKIWIKNNCRTLTAQERAEIQGILESAASQP
jgi:hypothetical protein